MSLLSGTDEIIAEIEKSMAKSPQISYPYMHYLPSLLLSDKKWFLFLNKGSLLFVSFHKHWKCGGFFQAKNVLCISHISYRLLLVSREHCWAIKTSVARAWPWTGCHWSLGQQHQRTQPCCSTCDLPLVWLCTLASVGHEGGRKSPVLLRSSVSRGISMLWITGVLPLKRKLMVKLEP